MEMDNFIVTSGDEFEIKDLIIFTFKYFLFILSLIHLAI